MSFVRATSLFLLAGLAEIGGGYLVWLWLRESRSAVLGLVGGLVLVLYGVIPTLQQFPHFGRVYAAYGGVFVAFSVLWGWGIDHVRTDRWDVTGSLVCLLGVAIILYGPRRLSGEPGDRGPKPPHDRFDCVNQRACIPAD